jgi:hypothetical protein
MMAISILHYPACLVLHHATELYENNGDGTFSAVVNSFIDTYDGFTKWADHNNDNNLDSIHHGE